MKNKGSITVYLSIILVSVIVVVNVMVESLRVNVVQTRGRSVTHIATESVMAGYARQIYKDYGVLLVWENETAKEKLEKYIQDNINMASLNERSIDFLKLNLVDINVKGPEYVIDNEKLFVKQIMNYMKYAGTMNAVTELVELFNGYSENDVESKKNNDVTVIVDEKSNELVSLVEEINEAVVKLSDVVELEGKNVAVRQEIDKLNNCVLGGLDEEDGLDGIKKFKKVYKKLMKQLDDKANKSEKTINLIKKYQEKKKKFIKENGNIPDEGDYIESNLSILENIKDKIEKNKELNVSKYSNVDSKNLETIKKSEDYIEVVIEQLKSLNINKSTPQDEKNKSIYESAVALLKKGVLSLVVEDVSGLSNNAISLSNLPTTIKSEKKTKEDSVLSSASDKAGLALYADMKFGNYRKCVENTALKYEMEYIIGGQDCDSDNLLKTSEKLALIRNAMNLMYIISDKEKMATISTVSASATTAIGLPFLEPVIKAVITEAWAMAESINDVKELLKGEEIPLIKKESDWNTSLENLLPAKSQHYKGEKGINYEMYLKMLIMLENNKKCVHRIMDLLQLNVQKRYNKSFMMSDCFQALEYDVVFEIKPLFTSMPWVSSKTGKNGSYKYQIKSSYSY